MTDEIAVDDDDGNAHRLMLAIAAIAAGENSGDVANACINIIAQCIIVMNLGDNKAALKHVDVTAQAIREAINENWEIAHAELEGRMQ
jgi:hypothetical protein